MLNIRLEGKQPIYEQLCSAVIERRKSKNRP